MLLDHIDQLIIESKALSVIDPVATIFKSAKSPGIGAAIGGAVSGVARKAKIFAQGIGAGLVSNVKPYQKAHQTYKKLKETNAALKEYHAKVSPTAEDVKNVNAHIADLQTHTSKLVHQIAFPHKFLGSSPDELRGWRNSFTNASNADINTSKVGFGIGYYAPDAAGMYGLHKYNQHKLETATPADTNQVSFQHLDAIRKSIKATKS